MDEIIAYLHCRSCQNGRLTLGLINPNTMRIWCERCDKKVADLAINAPIEPRCDVCGEVTGPKKHIHY